MDNSLNNLLAAANQIILGKDRQIRLAVCCLLARGHLLIEDVPGVGKTTLSPTLAKLFGLDYQRYFAGRHHRFFGICCRQAAV